ncbi:ankyrin repeat domain-containing protein [Candidatus Dependentiae bacterium]|jgi:ankyrin repeat protein|nr:ankyrin repeat domain-containing protein [Candidatus Dependentiae bacterium]
MNIKRYFVFVIISLSPHIHHLLAQEEVNVEKDPSQINKEEFLPAHSSKSQDYSQNQDLLRNQVIIACEPFTSETDVQKNQRELDEKLILAVDQKDLTQVKSLLTCGAKGDSVHFSSTAIHKAALIGHEEILQALLNAGVDKNVLDSDGATPLHCAVKNGHLMTLQILLAAGAKTEIHDNEGWTPLHYALLNNDAAAAEELLIADTRKLIFRV